MCLYLPPRGFMFFLRIFSQALMLTTVFLSTSIYSQSVEPLSPDERPTFHLSKNTLELLQETEEKQSTVIQEQNMTSQELLAQPVLLTQALNSAITLQDESALILLLPLYAQLPEKDEMLYKYGQAMLFFLQENPKEAVQLYEEILTSYPNSSPLRFQLALSLLADKRLAAANEQFTQLNNEELPPEIRQTIKNLQAGIAKQLEWQFNFHAHGLMERNINGSPAKQQVGAWKFAPPEKAYGLAYGLSADKLWALDGHWYLAVSASANGKTFWQKHEYDDLLLRSSIGLMWKNSKNEWGILPFHERRFYGSDSYSYGNGLRLQGNWQINEHWKWFANYEIADNRFFTRKHLDGISQRLGNTLFYRPDIKQYFTFGIDLGKEAAKDRSNAYDYYGLRLGWGKEWQQGISSMIQIHALKKDYAEKDFIQIKRQDERYGLNLSLWKRDWHWQNFTPRLTYQWKRQRSNHFAYDQAAEQNIFIEISKDF